MANSARRSRDRDRMPARLGRCRAHRRRSISGSSLIRPQCKVGGVSALRGLCGFEPWPDYQPRADEIVRWCAMRLLCRLHRVSRRRATDRGATSSSQPSFAPTVPGCGTRSADDRDRGLPQLRRLCSDYAKDGRGLVPRCAARGGKERETNFETCGSIVEESGSRLRLLWCLCDMYACDPQLA